MSQRNSGYEREEKDYYPTPSWVTEALIPHLRRKPRVVWEPACGENHMANVLSRHMTCYGTDIARGQDFLSYTGADGYDAIITNPPYNLSVDFIEHSLRLMEPEMGMVAMLLRTDYDHAKTRARLFRDCPSFAKKVVLTKRITWFEPPPGVPGKCPSFNHAWYIWDYQHTGPPTIGYAP